MENRIKEQQLDMFAGRTSSANLSSNQLRLWLSSLPTSSCGTGEPPPLPAPVSRAAPSGASS
jgi:hypothetical protein